MRPIAAASDQGCRALPSSAISVGNTIRGYSSRNNSTRPPVRRVPKEIVSPSPALEEATRLLDRGWGRLQHLDSVSDDPEQREALLAEIAAKLEDAVGYRPSPSVVHEFFKRRGVTRKKRRRTPPNKIGPTSC